MTDRRITTISGTDASLEAYGHGLRADAKAHAAGIASVCSTLARAKKLPRAAECLVYSLTRSGVLAETTQKIGVSSASCGVKNA